ncbi:MAG: hypothetical protein V3V62_12130 [bacterium]
MFTANQGFSAVGPIAAGLLSDAYGPAAAFWLFGGIALASLCLFPLMPDAAAAAGRGGSEAAPPGSDAAPPGSDATPPGAETARQSS